MRQNWYDKTLFLAAAAFNLSTAAILLFRPDMVLARFGIIDPTAKWLARSLASSVTAWGVAYALVVVNPARFREFVRLGVLSKTLFFVIYAAAFFSDAISFSAFMPALVDLVLAGLFVEYLYRTRT
ncbi:MAG TPA: hypothetical protein VFZ34_03765 [Blastocatellia bacterium]|nr:hypothetical protein [Blastocatellia bacterium]